MQQNAWQFQAGGSTLLSLETARLSSRKTLLLSESGKQKDIPMKIPWISLVFEDFVLGHYADFAHCSTMPTKDTCNS